MFSFSKSHVFVLNLSCPQVARLPVLVSCILHSLISKRRRIWKWGRLDFTTGKRSAFMIIRGRGGGGRHHAIWYALSGCMECSVAIACFVDVVYRKKPLPCMPLPCMSAIFGVSLAIQKQLPKIKHIYLLSCM